MNYTKALNNPIFKIIAKASQELNVETYVIGGFVPSVYWTSSENNTSFVWTQYFNNGYQGSILKNETHNIRAIRKF